MRATLFIEDKKVDLEDAYQWQAFTEGMTFYYNGKPYTVYHIKRVLNIPGSSADFTVEIYLQ